MHHEKSKVRPGQELQGKQGVYLVEAPLGEGGFGITFLARRQQDELPVVVKLLKMERAGDWKAVELFEREADVLRGLSHPNIPKYLDSFSLGDQEIPSGFALVQSFVEGKTLRERMRQKESLRPEGMFRWFFRMLEICQYLHQQSPPVIHRDINPKNIILGPQGDAVLIDFGTVQAKISSQHSVSSTSAGTFGYAPLEQFVGRASPSSDLYGLGMTFLAVATGKEPEALPFAGNRVDVRKALSDTQTDARILLAIDRMTQPDPDRRPAYALEVMASLEALRRLHTKPPPEEKQTPAPPPLPPAARQEVRSLPRMEKKPPRAGSEETPLHSEMGDRGREDVRMSSFTFYLPDIGEGIAEGEIVSVLVKEGDRVEEDQILAEVMADKATVEIPSPQKGFIQEVHVQEGDVVQVDAPMFTIGLGARSAEAPKPQDIEVPEPPAPDPFFEIERWKEARERLSQIPPGTLFGARPEIPLGKIEHVAFDDTGSRALLVAYEGCYLLDLGEMRTRRLVSHAITSRKGSFSADGRVLLIADHYSELLYFVDLPSGKEPVVRAVARPELKALGNDLSVAVSPDHQLAALGARQGDGSVALLFDWESAEVSNRLSLPWDIAPRLLFSPDGSDLYCGGHEETWCFKTGGDKEILPSSHHAISPDGKHTAFVRHADGEHGLYITSAPSFVKIKIQLPRHEKHEAEVEGLRFSPDGKFLGAIVRLPGRSGANVQVIVIGVASGKILAQRKEPHHPEPCFTRVDGISFSEEGRLFVFAESRASRTLDRATTALLVFAPNPAHYLGAVQLVKRDAKGGSKLFVGGKAVSAEEIKAMGITVAGGGQSAEESLKRFAGPPGDPDLALPFGETPSGFFGRLDKEQSIGAAGWIEPFERPGMVRSALLGAEEESLLDETDQLRSADLETRLAFWQARRAEGRVVGSLDTLVDASRGLTHLLPMVISHAEKSAQAKRRFGGSGQDAVLSEGLLVKAYQEIAGYSEAEREARFEEMVVLLEASGRESARLLEIAARERAQEEEEQARQARERAQEEEKRRLYARADQMMQMARDRIDIQHVFLPQAAEIYQKLGEPQRALSMWEKILAEDERNLQARDAVEKIYESMGDWKKLTDSLRIRAQHTRDPQKTADILYRREQIIEEQRQRFKEALKEALDGAPSYEDALAAIERLASDPSSLKMLRGILAQTAKEAQGEARLHLLLLLARLSEERWSSPLDAIRYCGEALAAAPGDYEIVEWVCRLLAQERRWPEIVALLTKQIPYLAPQDALRAKLHFARVQGEELGHRDDALTMYRQILEQAPEHPEALSAIERFRQRHILFLREELHGVGVAPGEYAMLLMLPLLEVAWADGTLQAKEAEMIWSAAKERGLLDADEQHPTLTQWSTTPPPVVSFAKARELLVTLADEEDYPDITREKLTEIVLLCREIASSAGGFLGFGRVSDAEKEVLARIEADLTRK